MWLALILFSADSLVNYRSQRKAQKTNNKKRVWNKLAKHARLQAIKKVGLKEVADEAKVRILALDEVYQEGRTSLGCAHYFWQRTAVVGKA